MFDFSLGGRQHWQTRLLRSVICAATSADLTTHDTSRWRHHRPASCLCDRGIRETTVIGLMMYFQVCLSQRSTLHFDSTTSLLLWDLIKLFTNHPTSWRRRHSFHKDHTLRLWFVVSCCWTRQRAVRHVRRNLIETSRSSRRNIAAPLATHGKHPPDLSLHASDHTEAV